MWVWSGSDNLVHVLQMIWWDPFIHTTFNLSNTHWQASTLGMGYNSGSTETKFYLQSYNWGHLEHSLMKLEFYSSSILYTCSSSNLSQLRKLLFHLFNCSLSYPQNSVWYSINISWMYNDRLNRRVVQKSRSIQIDLKLWFFPTWHKAREFRDLLLSLS